MHVASHKVLAYCNKPKVGIKLYELAISFQNIAAWEDFSCWPPQTACFWEPYAVYCIFAEQMSKFVKIIVC